MFQYDVGLFTSPISWVYGDRPKVTENFMCILHFTCIENNKNNALVSKYVSKSTSKAQYGIFLFNL